LMFLAFFYLAFQNSEAYAIIFFVFVSILFFSISKHKKMRWLLYVFNAFVLVFVLLQHYLFELSIFNPISSLIMPQYAASNAYSFSSRFSWIFVNNLSLLLVSLLVLGIAVALFSKKKENLFMISLFFFALFLYLFPETYAYRFFKELTIVMAFIMALAIWRIFRTLVDSKKKYSTFIFSVLIIVLLLPSLIAPVYQRYYQSNLSQPLISEYEYSASTWLRTNTPENSILISDFETMQLVGPLSNKLLPIQRNMNVEGLKQNDVEMTWLIKDLLKNSISTSLMSVNESQFWKPYGFGVGSMDITANNISQQSNNATLQINIVPGSKSTVGVIHVFKENQDWTNASGLYINWYGDNTNVVYEICIAAPDDLNWFAFNLIDNFTGWQGINIPFSSFSKVGSPSWTDVYYIAVRTTNKETSGWLLGDIGLGYATFTLNFTSKDISYFRNHVSLTDYLYSERKGLSTSNASILFVLTQRTVEWFKQQDISGIADRPHSPVDPAYIELFMENPNLHLIYSYEDYIYIFEAT
jgi:hypothetical protein